MWIRSEEQAVLRQMRREGMTIDEIVVASGRSKTAVNQAVNDVETVLILSCSWCPEMFEHEPCRGRPPGYCSNECRYQAALERKRVARSSAP